MSAPGRSVKPMDEATIARWRVHHHHLAAPPAATPASAVEHLVAVQGQDLLPSAWAIGSRTSLASTEHEVMAAYDAGDILRTHVLRPTWHFVTPATIRTTLAATAARVHQLNGTIYRQHGFTDDTFRTITATFDAVLSQGAATRADLREALAQAGLDVSGQGLAYAVMYAELEGQVCSGPRRGKTHTYRLLDDVAPGPWPEVATAQAELARGYYRSRGPATVRDLAGWASLTIAQARAATATLGEVLDSFTLEGRTYYSLAGHEPPPATGTGVLLVNGLDDLVMSYSDSRDVLIGSLPWGEGAPVTMYHAIVNDGRAIGQWAYERDSKGRPARIVYHRLRPWSPEEEAGMEKAVAAFGSFVGAEVSWR